MDVNKAELIQSVAGEFDLPKRQTGDIVDMVLEQIQSALKAGDRVQLSPFGSFEVRDRKKREGRNPKTGEALVIAARRVPAFTPGKALREAVGGKKKTATKSSATVKKNAKRA
jgi:DNA-binding protein HU-beta